MKENPLQYRVRGTPVPTTQTRGTNYPKSTRIPLADFEHTVFLSWVISQATAATLNFILQSKWVFTSENTSR